VTQRGKRNKKWEKTNYGLMRAKISETVHVVVFIKSTGTTKKGCPSIRLRRKMKRVLMNTVNRNHPREKRKAGHQEGEGQT